MGEDSFQNLAKDRGEFGGTIGRGFRGRLAGFREQDDAGITPQVSEKSWCRG